MRTHLVGLGVKNYRGIGEDEQLLFPFKDLNIFIGANNAGKSAILSFISQHLNQAGSGNGHKLSPLDLHEKATGAFLSVALRSESFFDLISKKVKTEQDSLKRLVDALSIDGAVWVTTPISTTGSGWSLKHWNADIDQCLQANEWNSFWRSLTNSSGGDLKTWISQVRATITKRVTLTFPKVRLIPAIRKIGPPGGQLSYGGEGLIEKLAEIQNPNYDRLNDQLLFDSINEFLRTVTGNVTAKIQIPNKREHILVHLDGKTLPISSLGTGIHEVILIAAFCTLSQNEIVCIEEPELHLHPLLQKKLIKYLMEKTTNQYFIATHSPSFIDTSGAALFHVRNETGRTKISECVLRRSLYAICDDLGHKASELAQANAVIWVEGPSDRIYLKHWIEALAPDLVEGIHYSIMFYGGRLLSHLSAELDEVGEFIDLRSLNRNVAILIDSDLKEANGEINSTKLRVSREFVAGGSLAWITAGREIENYIDSGLLQKCVRELYSNIYGGPVGGGLFDHALHFKPSEQAARNKASGHSAVTDVDKVAIARAVVKYPANLDVLDLRVKVEALVSMIRTANS